MKTYLLLMLGLGSACLASAQALYQQTSLYPDDQLSPAFHVDRRAAFKAAMPARSMAVFFASQVRLRNDDVDFPYAQNKNFYYLTGLEEPNAVLLLFKEPTTLEGKTSTEFLFVQARDPQRELWTGKILGAEGVKARWGWETVFVNSRFDPKALPQTAIDSVLTLYQRETVLETYPRTRDALSQMATQLDQWLKANAKPIAANKTVQIMSQLRAIKTPEEIRLLEKATLMSCAGHNAVMAGIRPGMTEYQAQAIMEYQFKINGAEFFGYPSINGAADNACVLHYVTNKKRINNGELLLSDCAAEYHGYTADVTRTVPANGKFSPEQKIIYELVLAAQDSAIAACIPGNPFSISDATARRVINRGLIRLGIAANETEARQYFPHGTSHHLGLDVHDLGPRGNSPFMPGMFLTVEPGIYIPPNSKCDPKWWNIGVRIEDDILITEKGNKNFSAASPRTVAEIEKLVASKKKPL
jgi:Xaa-Pro aminopeptidase